MKRFFITLLFISILLNLLLLNFAVFKNKLIIEEKETTATTITPPQPTSPPTNFCPAGCVGLIKESAESSKTAQTKTTTVVNAVPKESFITFGSGTNASENWEDVPGLQAYIDTANYPNIKTVTFEATIHIPTGNQTADVRLFNATDQHPVWFSEMHHSGGGEAKLLTSQPVTLDKGNKLYKVQMKTQLKFQANLDSSRLRILTY